MYISFTISILSLLGLVALFGRDRTLQRHKVVPLEEATENKHIDNFFEYSINFLKAFFRQIKVVTIKTVNKTMPFAKRAYDKTKKHVGVHVDMVRGRSVPGQKGVASVYLKDLGKHRTEIKKDEIPEELKQ